MVCVSSHLCPIPHTQGNMIRAKPIILQDEMARDEDKGFFSAYKEKIGGGFHSLLKEISLETYGPEVYLQPFAIWVKCLQESDDPGFL